MMYRMIKDFLKYYLRNGKVFQRYLQELEKTEKYSAIEIQNYQNEKLQRIIHNAYENVPYYRRVFDELNLKPSDIRTKEDLQKLPMIDKDIVRKNFNDFTNKNFKGFVFKAYTGGTTGTPGLFLRDLISINFENAILWRQYRWMGKESNSRRVTIRGELIFPAEKKTPPFWKHNRISNELIMSSYHLSEKNSICYIDKINDYQPYDLHAYPASAYLLAQYCLLYKRKLHIPAIFTSSEMLLPPQRKVIEDAFKGKVYDWYGQVERVGAIGQCSLGKYHIIEDYSIDEWLPREKGKYELVGTTINNSVMPLIRYKTADIMDLDSNSSYCHCGCFFKSVQKIDGRLDTYLKTSDGRLIGPAALSLIPRGVSHIIESQFVQKSKNSIVIKVVCTREFSKIDEELLLRKAREYISKEMQITVNKVDKIPRTKNGKFLLVVSEVQLDQDVKPQNGDDE